MPILFLHTRNTIYRYTWDKFIYSFTFFFIHIHTSKYVFIWKKIRYPIAFHNHHHICMRLHQHHHRDIRICGKILREWNSPIFFSFQMKSLFWFHEFCRKIISNTRHLEVSHSYHRQKGSFFHRGFFFINILFLFYDRFLCTFMPHIETDMKKFFFWYKKRLWCVWVSFLIFI